MIQLMKFSVQYHYPVTQIVPINDFSFASPQSPNEANKIW